MRRSSWLRRLRIAPHDRWRRTCYVFVPHWRKWCENLTSGGEPPGAEKWASNEARLAGNFPITPRLCLQFICPEIADRLRFSRLRQIYIQAKNAGNPVMLEPKNVEFINFKEVVFSERFHFARSEQDFALAKSMLQETPDLTAPASTRTIAE